MLPTPKLRASKLLALSLFATLLLTVTRSAVGKEVGILSQCKPGDCKCVQDMVETARKKRDEVPYSSEKKKILAVKRKLFFLGTGGIPTVEFGGPSTTGRPKVTETALPIISVDKEPDTYESLNSDYKAILGSEVVKECNDGCLKVQQNTYETRDSMKKKEAEQKDLKSKFEQTKKEATSAAEKIKKLAVKKKDQEKEIENAIKSLKACEAKYEQITTTIRPKRTPGGKRNLQSTSANPCEQSERSVKEAEVKKTMVEKDLDDESKQKSELEANAKDLENEIEDGEKDISELKSLLYDNEDTNCLSGCPGKSAPFFRLFYFLSRASAADQGRQRNACVNIILS